MSDFSGPPQPGAPVPQPQGFLQTNNSPVPTAYRPQAQRRAVKVGAPIGVLLALGVLLMLWFGYFSLAGIGATLISALLATVAISVVVLVYLLLDRWEPEPPRLLILAFLWGATVATLVAVVVNTAFGAIFGEGLAGVVSAPIIEELGKGAILLIMLTGRRRKELLSLTDFLIYAGLSAAGFAWLEDILYLLNNPDAYGTVAIMRLVFSPFAHPLFTSVTAIGVYFAMRQKTSGARTGLIIAGFVGAMALHAAWNGSTSFGGGMGFLVGYVLIGVPLFAGAIVLAIMSRRRERQLVAKHLPRMASDGILTQGQAASFTTMAGRKAARSQVAASGKQSLDLFRQLTDAATELAFVRDRFDHGLADQRMYQLHQDLVAACRHARAEAPVLDQIQPPPMYAGPGQGPYGQVEPSFGPGQAPYGQDPAPHGQGPASHGPGQAPYGQGPVPYGQGPVPYGQGPGQPPSVPPQFGQAPQQQPPAG